MSWEDPRFVSVARITLNDVQGVTIPQNGFDVESPLENKNEIKNKQEIFFFFKMRQNSARTNYYSYNAWPTICSEVSIRKQSPLKAHSSAESLVGCIFLLRQ